MSKIIQLDQNLANQIAAGEVVERPVSVIKELVENSIDAGAKNVKIEIKDGGKTYISVSDDGEGIEKEDLEICIDKYTTSKIKNLEDLYNVMTFGFRGEALASISAVSKFEIISKTKNSSSSYKLTFDNISGKKISEFISNTGTQIIVKDLFFNTPARLNYLKTDKTEYSKILDYLYSASLANPEIGFEFINDEKRIFKFNSGEDLKTRIFEIYGDEFFSNLLELNFEGIGIKVKGFISDPKISFQTKSRQNLFVNKRPITSPLIFKAINDAYNRFIPHSQNPGYVINLEVNPTIIDVNVHPRKQEIRFENEQNIFRSVYHAVLDKLEGVSLINPPILTDIPLNKGDSDRREQGDFGNFNSPNIIKEPTQNYYTGSGTKFKSYSPYKDTSSNPNQFKINDAINFSRAILDTDIDNKNNGIFEEKNSGDLHYTKLGKIVGQTFNSYIIVENDNKIIILDQHALAERIIYERLSKIDKNINSQGLLIPENLKLTPEEINIIETQKNIFLDMGFELEILGNNILSITGIPDFVKKEELKNVILGIIQDISSGNILKSKTLEEIKNKIFAYTACRSAIKFGNKLNLFEMNKLLNESVDTYSSTCPHGRPVIYEIDLSELKDKYER